MKRLFCLTVVLPAIALMNSLSATAQQTPSTGSDTAALGGTISSRGLCGVEAVSGGSASDSTYMAGPTASAGATPGAALSAGTASASSTSGSDPAVTKNRSQSANATYIVDSENDSFGLNEIEQSESITLQVGGSSLCYVNINPIDNSDSNDNIRVFDDATNQELGIKVTKKDRGAARVSFVQPVPPGLAIRIEMRGVRRPSRTSQSTVTQYSLSGGQANYTQDVPYGITQVRNHMR
jgi:hypothetical protein